MISKKSMIITAAIFYLVGASQLLTFSFLWIKKLNLVEILIGAAIGILIGAIKFFYLFKKLNLKNISRIMKGDEKQKILSVFKVKTYVIILGMIFLGISLRVILNISRVYLFPVYLAIGLALLLSSIMYFVYYFRHSLNND